ICCGSKAGIFWLVSTASTAAVISVARREPLSSALLFSAAPAAEYGEARSAASTGAARRHLTGGGERRAILGWRTKGIRRDIAERLSAAIRTAGLCGYRRLIHRRRHLPKRWGEMVIQTALQIRWKGVESRGRKGVGDPIAGIAPR